MLDTQTQTRTKRAAQTAATAPDAAEDDSLGDRVRRARTDYDGAVTAAFKNSEIEELRDRTARQYQLLRAISRHQPCSQTILVETTQIDRSTIAEMVDRLTKQRLVARKRTKEDARAYAVTLTDAGRALYQKARRIVDKLEKAMEAKGTVVDFRLPS